MATEITTRQIKDKNVTLSKISDASANSKLLGSGASGSGFPYVELTLGTNLSISGTTLNAAGGGGGGGSSTPIGQVQWFGVAGGDSHLTGDNWLELNGQVVSQSTYATLYTRTGILSTVADPASFTSGTKAPNVTFTSVATTGSGNLYVAVGPSGQISSSTDGTTWTARTTGTTTNLTKVVYANSLFVAGGANGAILTSTDGTTWTARTSGTTSGVAALTYENSKYLAALAGGGVIHSTDAITWTSVNTGTTSALCGIGYGNGEYVASGTSVIKRSTDLVTWTTPTFPGNIIIFNNVAGGNTVAFLSGRWFFGTLSTGVLSTTDFSTFDFPITIPQASTTYCGVIDGKFRIASGSGQYECSSDGKYLDYLGPVAGISAVGINGICVDSTRSVLVGANALVSVGNGSTYTYNSATSFKLPNLNPTGQNNLAFAVGNGLNGKFKPYIKAL